MTLPTAASFPAIIGMACRLPGGVHDAHSFWRLLHEGRCAIAECPRERLALAGGAIRLPPGAYLDADVVASFDVDFFAIDPSEACRLDPQHRLLLTLTAEALDDAGLPRAVLSEYRVGVIIGLMAAEYGDLQRAAGAEVEDGGLYLDSAMASARIAHTFGFKGPSLSIGTACTSGLAALHNACRALRAGEIDVAIVGAASLLLALDHQRTLQRLGLVSPDGTCRSFEARAAGCVRGEGAVALVAMRADDAAAAGLRTHGLVLGTAIGHSGAAGSLTTPNGPAIERTVADALVAAGVEPDAVCHVQAHGAGTPLGDAMEVNALATVLGCASSRAAHLRSVKANIGHGEAVGGLASLLALVLALRHGSIPPQAGFERSHPYVAGALGVLDIDSRGMPWPRGEQPRIGLAEAYALGGTTAAAVVAEPPAEAKRHVEETADWQILPLSARSAPALEARAHQCAAFLQYPHAAASLAEICATAACRRDHHSQRLAGVARSSGDMVREIERALTRSRTVGGRPSVAFLFSGQGNQWPAMGAELLRAEPVFRREIEACEAALAPRLRLPLTRVLQEPDEYDSLLDIAIAQPAMAAYQISLCTLWREWGIEPAATLGYSVGEIAAAHAAGLIDLETAMRIAAAQGEGLARSRGGGSMVAIGLSADMVALRLAPYGDALEIGADNSPRSCTVTGDTSAIEELSNDLRKEDVAVLPLPLPYAFHGRQIQHARDFIVKPLEDIDYGHADVSFVSSLTGALADASMLDATHWWRIAREPVQFRAAMDQLIDLGTTVFLEIGPQPMLGLASKECLEHRRRPGVFLASQRRTPEPRRTRLQTLGALYEHGASVNWERVLPVDLPIVDLPPYPWQLERHWISVGGPHPAPATAACAPKRERDAAGRLPDLTNAIRTEAARLMGWPPSAELDPDIGFFDLGMTSTMAVSLKEHLESRLGLKIAATIAFDHPTARLLALHLDRRLAAEQSNGHG